MITGKNILISFWCTLLFRLLSCSKSDHATNPSSNYILNTFTYTITDTTGVDHTYSDTAKLNPDGTYYFEMNGKFYLAEPNAFIWQPFPDRINRFQFYFVYPSVKIPGSFNTLIFSLPYFQASLAGTNIDSLVPPVSWNWEGVSYYVAQPQPQYGVIEVVYLAGVKFGTNISDSTGGYVTGSFNISATTVDSCKIQVAGKFSNLPTTFKP